MAHPLACVSLAVAFLNGGTHCGGTHSPAPPPSPLPPGWGWGWGWVLAEAGQRLGRGWVLAAIKKAPLLGPLVVMVV